MPRSDGLAAEAFHEGLRRTYEDVLANSSGLARSLRGHDWNTVLPGDGMAA